MCEWLDWRGRDGQLKVGSCRIALSRLEKRGVLELPAPKGQIPQGRPPSPFDEPRPSRVECSVGELGELRAVVVTSSEPELNARWKRLMAHHYLGATLAGHRSATCSRATRDGSQRSLSAPRPGQLPRAISGSVPTLRPHSEGRSPSEPGSRSHRYRSHGLTTTVRWTERSRSGSDQRRACRAGGCSACSRPPWPRSHCRCWRWSTGSSSSWSASRSARRNAGPGSGARRPGEGAGRIAGKGVPAAAVSTWCGRAVSRPGPGGRSGNRRGRRGRAVTRGADWSAPPAAHRAPGRR